MSGEFPSHERIKAVQAGLVEALVGVHGEETDDGQFNVADVENAAPNEIILKGLFNTYTLAIIALLSADKVDAEAGVPRLPGIVSTEWGVENPWGTSTVSSADDARAMVRNMTAAGHEAGVVWRGVTEWQKP